MCSCSKKYDTNILNALIKIIYIYIYIEILVLFFLLKIEVIFLIPARRPYIDNMSIYPGICKVYLACRQSVQLYQSKNNMDTLPSISNKCTKLTHC